MRLKGRIAVSVGSALVVIIVLWLSRPVIEVKAATPLWACEYDASRQGTIYPGTGTPLLQLTAGDRLRVVWDTYGKDYHAFFVIGPNCTKGWVLHGQEGLALPAE